MSKLSVQDEFRAIQTFSIDIVDEEKRTVRLTGSSEYPVERINYATGERYIEILSHNPDDLDLSRMRNGGPVLDRHFGDQIAVIEDAGINVDRKTEFLIRFSSATERANIIFKDVVDNIRRNVSVGYRKKGVIRTEKQDRGLKRHFFSWEPYELSFEPIPADPTVGVGRSMDSTRQELNINDLNNDEKRAVSLVILTQKENKK